MGQLAGCDCIVDVLALKDEEKQAVEEYIDDSVEPLKGLMSRWEAALNEQGRIPHKSRPLATSPDDLILAAARGNLAILRYLLDEGVPIDATNEAGYTALMAAARNYRVDVLHLLLDLKADVHLRDIYGHTPLHCSVGSPPCGPMAGDGTQADCIRSLVEHGAAVDALAKDGSTPLQNAAWFGLKQCVEYLLRMGADRTIRDIRNRTAYDLAQERGHKDIATLLSVG